MSELRPEKEWWTAQEIAEAGLVDLPETRQGIDALIKRDNWQSTSFARRRQGRGGGWEYSWKLFPQFARRALLKAVAKPVIAEPPRKDRDAAWAWFDALPQEVKAKAAARLKVIQQVEAEVALGQTKFLAVALICLRESVSEKTVWNWFAMIEGVERHDRLAYLAPRNRAAPKRAKTAPMSPEFFERLKAAYLRLEEPTLAASYEIAVKLSKANGWAYPSLRTAERYIAEIPRVTRVFARQGYHGLSKCFPPQIRDRSGMSAMEGVVADCHKIDVFVLWPGVDKPVRPQIAVFSDLYSNKMLAWRVDRDPNKVAVMSAFGEMVETYGIPRTCLFDNGMEFANKWLTGGTRDRFRFKVRPDDPLGVLPQLGIEVHFAKPAHGQAKPIERSFRDIADRVARDPRFAGAYVGNRPDAKPENYMSRAIPLAEFIRVLDEGIQDFNARQKRTTDVARGRSFDDAFNESYAVTKILKATAEQRRFWLMGQQVLTANRNHGRVKMFGAHYWSEWMNEYAGQKLTCRFDPEDLNAGLYIYALDGAFLGFAECQIKTPFYDLASAKEQARKEARRRKIERALLKEYRSMDVDELAAEMNAMERPEPAKMEAKVVEMVQRGRGPIIERPTHVVETNPEAEARHQAHVLEFQAAAKKKPERGETADDRFRWALEIERRIEAGAVPEPQDLQRLGAYQQTAEYKAKRDQWRDFGDESFGASAG